MEEVLGRNSLHRSEAFVKDFQTVRDFLCRLLNAQQVEIMMGPGTLANDAIAAQLSLLCKTGLILVSGEFGRRLVRSANGAKLFFHVLEVPEGEAFDRGRIEKILKTHSDIGWMWGTWNSSLNLSRIQIGTNLSGSTIVLAILFVLIWKGRFYLQKKLA